MQARSIYLNSRNVLAGVTAAGLLVVGSQVAAAASANRYTFELVHTFYGSANGDGAEPVGPLIEDKSGSIYGTTEAENASSVYQVASGDSYKVLLSFASCYIACGPAAGVLRVERQLVGTTLSGGSQQCDGGCGTVFSLAPNGTMSVLYDFQGGSDGAAPGPLIEDQSGNFFGTTLAGGGSGCNGSGCGTVFELTPQGTETILYAFQGGDDGAVPSLDAKLIEVVTGSLYGTTAEGGGSGCDGYGCGTVFEIAGGTETILHTFEGGNDGEDPGYMIMDAAGNFYGETWSGGGAGCGGIGCGTVFELTPSGSETILHSFQGGKDGANPSGQLIRNSRGDFYGVTADGGSAGCGGYGCGTVFELGPDGSEKILYSFRTEANGRYPETIFLDKSGNLYGTTVEGGYVNKKIGCRGGCGVIFRLTKS